MVDFENLDLLGELRTPHAERVESCADQYVLSHPSLDCSRERILRIAGPRDDVRKRRAAEQTLLCKLQARLLGREPLAPGIVDERVRVQPSMERAHQCGRECSTA